jgi:hypothetical protein
VSGEHRKEPRPCNAVATAGLLLAALATIFILGYASIVKGDAASTSTIGTLATLAVGALVSLTGARTRGGGGSD